MVLYYIFLYLAWNSCIKLVPHQLTVILGLVSAKAVFLGNYYPKNPVVTHSVSLSSSLISLAVLARALDTFPTRARTQRRGARRRRVSGDQLVTGLCPLASPRRAAPA